MKIASLLPAKRFQAVSAGQFCAVSALAFVLTAGCNGVVHTTTNGNASGGAGSGSSGSGGNSGGGSGSGTGSGSGSAIAPTITTQPVSQSVTAGQTAIFTVVAAGSPTLTYQWQRNNANVSGATAATYSTAATSTSDSGATFDVVVSNSAGSVTSINATLTVNAPSGGTTPPVSGSSSVDVTTYHYDNLRTGQNTHETTLTPANVNSTSFGLLGSFSVDGHVDAQPLYLSSLAIPGQGTKNVLYVVTEHDSVYAFDADSVSGNHATTLWHSSMLASSETSSDDRGCGQVTPEIGITSTPVIDRARNAIYLIAVSKTSAGKYIHRFHALDLTTGKDLSGSPTTITATYPGNGANSSNGNVVFDPAQYNERPGLLQIGGTIFTTWGSHCDAGPYTSWVMAYSADTLKQTGVINMVPNGNEGGIWMAGTAPAADASGNIYFIIGNGDFGTSLDANGFPSNKNCGNCFAKVSSTMPLGLMDYFTPLNTVSESNGDTDFGSGGPLLLPDVVDSNGVTRHLAVGSGKDSNIYVVDRDNMGKFNSSKDNIYQQINGALSGGVWSKPSYFNGVVYYGAVGDSIKAFPISGGKLATTASSQSSHSFGYPGATPAISANGTTNGIVWVVENGGTGVLHAYDATNLANELYNSTQDSNGQFSGNKFITPMIVNGRVYIGTQSSVVAFSLK
ncbi:MAG: pyrrolo-quinoline quinone [Acidobacteria bacterium]|nr:pyrrolo-quinoline quinone [Acidobacteriota bacterium]